MAKARRRLKEEAPPELRFDLEEAQRFLNLLDPEAKQFTFQTYDDWKEPNSKLAKIVHGTLDEHERWLRAQNRRGAAVLVSMNETDGRGRKAENITLIRVNKADMDDKPLPTTWPLDPHIVVESSEGRYHVYWRVNGLPLDKFVGVQLSIAQHFDSDSGVAKLPECARLPGFYHMKDFEHPFRTRIITESDAPPYDAATVLKVFPPIERPHKPSGSRAGMLILDPQDPRVTAREFVQRYFHPEGAPELVAGLVHYRDDFYCWDGTRYAPIEERELEARLYKFLEHAFAYKGQGIVPFKPNKNKIANIMHALARGTMGRSEWEVPFTLTREDVPPRGMLPCGNGMLDIRQGILHPHRPEIFNINVLDFDYDPNAAKPTRWYKFLRELWPEDQESRRVLQEILGYLISVDTDQQKIFLLVGPKRGGKGTILRVLIGIIGKQNAASPTFKSLASNFGLQPLIGKTLAAISDARMGANIDVATVVERMLRISGEDDVTADRKYKDHWTGRMGVRFLILTNELPKLTDASATVVSRLIPIMCAQSFYGKEDTQLTEALLLERPGIVNWAMRGYARLRERGYFVVPETARAALRQMEDLASPVKAFLRVRCVVGAGEWAFIDELYEAWTEWQQSQGYKTLIRSEFGQQLHAACPQVRRRQKKGGRIYVGVSLKRRQR